ncbi:MAG: EutN/CcmL family microcompartment protein [Phycisphaerales bacterium]|nr:EutN/CcmL family microcompartment protein [Phycisphaerales bacterium]
MFIGKVTGHVVTTQKEPAMADAKLLVVEAYNAAGAGTPGLRGTGKVLVAIDALGAGLGEFVLVTQGSSARLSERTRQMPVDAIVIGLVDSVRLGERVLGRAELDESHKGPK